MPHRGAPGFRPSDDGGVALPPALSAFDPAGEVTVADRRRGPRGAAFDPDGEIVVTDRRRGSRGVAFDPDGEIAAGDSRAATRAAMAEEFAVRFGLDEPGPSAAAIADRYDFRYEPSDVDPGLPVGRRTVTITGRGAERAIPPAPRTLPRASRSGRRAAARLGEPDRFRGDRAALWAVALALLLAFAAATSAHAAAHSLLLIH